MASRILDYRHAGLGWQPWRSAKYTPLPFKKDRTEGVAEGVQAVIEITYSASGDLPRELLRQAYVASQFGTIVLVLAGPTAAEIDSIIDDLVLQLPLDIPGVRYVDKRDEACILEFLLSAAHIFAPLQGGTLRSMAAQSGCEVRAPSAAQFLFDRRTGGAGWRNTS